MFLLQFWLWFRSGSGCGLTLVLAVVPLRFWLWSCSGFGCGFAPVLAVVLVRFWFPSSSGCGFFDPVLAVAFALILAVVSSSFGCGFAPVLAVVLLRFWMWFCSSFGCGFTSVLTVVVVSPHLYLVPVINTPLVLGDLTGCTFGIVDCDETETYVFCL